MPKLSKHPLTDIFTSTNEALFPIEHSQRRWLYPTHAAAGSLWLASLTDCPVANVANRLKVVVTKDQNQLNQIETELAFCGVDAYVFPDWEILTYDELSPHQDIVSERINLLTEMPKSGILLISIQTLMQRVAPPSWLIGQHFDLSVGDTFDINAQREMLAVAGYRAVDNVFEPGEFAVRGSVIDIFAMGQPFPLRLDLFDNEIETIRFFNPQTQRTLSTETLVDLVSGSADRTRDSQLRLDLTVESLSLLHKLPDVSKPITEFQILPAKEFPLDEGKEMFRNNFAAMFPNVSSRRFELHKDVMAGIASSGLEYYQPLFFDLEDWNQTGHLFTYFPQDTLFIVDEGIAESQADYWSQIQRRYEERRHDIDKPILEPKLLYLPSNETNEKLNAYSRIILSQNDLQASDSSQSGKVRLPAVMPPELACQSSKS